MEFVLDGVARSAATATLGASALNHEFFDHAVEDHAVVELFSDQFHEVGHRDRGKVLEQLSAEGAQIGFANYAKSFSGVQFAFVNYAERVNQGIQIGFVNVIRETKEWFKDFPKKVAPAMILANWRF